MDVQCLLSEPPPDLERVPLSCEAKRYLVNAAHEKGKGYRFVVQRYNLRYNSLRYYSRELAKGKILRPSGGRPTKLDEDSIMALRQWMVENPGWRRRALNRKIREEAVQTAARRHPDALPDDITVYICKDSVTNYANRLIRALDIEQHTATVV